jgi:MarR family transcriptional regulator, transcriptional regulator for hemolysin
MLVVDEQLSERFIEALYACGRAWRHALERELKASGLTGAGWSAIAALADMRRAGAAEVRPPSQTELAQLLGVDGATLVATIDRLAAAGLIERTPSRQDRRVKLVVLTSEGRLLEEKVRAQADALRRDAVAHLDAGEVAAAAAALERLQQVLERP